jgi:hypothetical protein
VTIKTDGFHFLLCSCDEAVDLVRQSTFHMDDDGDLQEQILHLEAQIEELADVIERCRKIILISKAAIAAGGTLILAIIIGAVGFDPTIMIGAIAAVIGGIVVFGSNTSIAPTRMGSSRYIKVSMRLHVLPASASRPLASGTMMTSTYSPMASLSAASSRHMPHRSGNRGCGH